MKNILIYLVCLCAICSCGEEDVVMRDDAWPFTFEVKGLSLTEGKNELHWEGEIPNSGLKFQITPSDESLKVPSEWCFFLYRLAVDGTQEHSLIEKDGDPEKCMKEILEKKEPFTKFKGNWGEITQESVFPYTATVIIEPNNSSKHRQFTITLSGPGLSKAFVNLTQEGK